MALVPVPQAGRLLRWNSTATALENATISDLLDEIAGAVAPDPAVRRYWLATPGVSVVAGGISLALTPGAPTVVAVAPVSTAISLTGIALSLTPTAPGVQVQAAGNFAVTLTGLALPLTPNAPAVAKSSAATLTGLSLALTTGNPGVSTAANVSVSAQTVNLSMTPNAPTVAAGGAASASDDFNRANGAIGTGWETPTGANPCAVSSNAAHGSTTGWCVSRRTESFAANHRAQGSNLSGGSPAVRVGASGQNGYSVSLVPDDGEGGGNYAEIVKWTNGTPSSIATGGTPDRVYYRIEASGTTITLRGSDNGSTWDLLCSTTDSTHSSGRPGVMADGTGSSVDNFVAADL